MLLGSRFQLVERVGVGGSASVYRARDTVRAGVVAVKLLHDELASDDELVERFRRESDILEIVDHPAIPPLVGRSSEDDPLNWFATAFVEGPSLALRIREGIGPTDAVCACVEIAGALQYLHELGIVHRDVKPENILFDGHTRARLVDLGIARVADDEVTRAGFMMGTPSFMSPEQQLDPRMTDPRSDVFSLGVTLFNALTRRSGLELLYAHTRPEALAALPPATREVVGRATEGEIGARYASASDLRDALAGALASL